MKNVSSFFLILVLLFSYKEEKKSRLNFENLVVSKRKSNSTYRFSFNNESEDDKIKLDTFNQKEIEKLNHNDFEFDFEIDSFRPWFETLFSDDMLSINCTLKNKKNKTIYFQGTTCYGIEARVWFKKNAVFCPNLLSYMSWSTRETLKPYSSIQFNSPIKVRDKNLPIHASFILSLISDKGDEREILPFKEFQVFCLPKLIPEKFKYVRNTKFYGEQTLAILDSQTQ